MFCITRFFSRNVRNSIKSEKNITPPPPPPFEIQNQNKDIEDIMDIDSNCPSLLFGETTSHLTSKWKMWEKHYTPPPPRAPFEIQNQNKGIEDIMDIDSNCPSLLLGETTSHLTSKWRGTFQYLFFLMLKIA